MADPPATTATTEAMTTADGSSLLVRGQAVSRINGPTTRRTDDGGLLLLQHEGEVVDPSGLTAVP